MSRYNSVRKLPRAQEAHSEESLSTRNTDGGERSPVQFDDPARFSESSSPRNLVVPGFVTSPELEDLEVEELELQLKLVRLRKSRLQRTSPTPTSPTSDYTAQTPVTLPTNPGVRKPSGVPVPDAVSTSPRSPIRRVSFKDESFQNGLGILQPNSVADAHPGEKRSQGLESLPLSTKTKDENEDSQNEHPDSASPPEKPVPVSLSSQQVQPDNQFVAKFNFRAQTSSELTLRVGRPLERLKDEVRGWSYYKDTESGLTGWAPVAYVHRPGQISPVIDHEYFSSSPTKQFREVAPPLPNVDQGLVEAHQQAEPHSSSISIERKTPPTDIAHATLENLTKSDSRHSHGTKYLNASQSSFEGPSGAVVSTKQREKTDSWNEVIVPETKSGTSNDHIMASTPIVNAITAPTPPPLYSAGSVYASELREPQSQGSAGSATQVNLPNFRTERLDSTSSSNARLTNRWQNELFLPNEDSDESDKESTNDTLSSQPSLDTSATSDHIMAMEIAAVEASRYFEEGRPDKMHPLLQEQLASAMKHYMPDDTNTDEEKTKNPEPSIGGSPTLVASYHGYPEVKDESGGAGIPNLGSQFDEVAKPRSESSNPFVNMLSKVRTTKRVIESSFAKRSSALIENRENQDMSPEDSEEGEDVCYCGKATVATDQCYYCWPCDGTVYCESCWDIPPPHRRGHKSSHSGRSRGKGVVHEKSDPASSRKIVEALHSDHSLEYQAFLHQRDEDTAWFGTGRDVETGDTVFQDFGRYSRLMAEMPSRDHSMSYPALVSFVGQTGAGKSSLIRLLIELNSPGNEDPQVPVIGSNLRSDLPTSGDVHLYADHSKIDTEHPILYADCEGLDGGEREPSGARLKRRKEAKTSGLPRTHSFARNIRRQHHTSEREILWATDTLRRSREYHVRHLYPRLLYTFSDVIVFVMKNPRVVESVIEQLLRWAADALETSSNQPVLPHAIIVLNAYDNASDAALWDANESTVNLMDRVSRAVHLNHNIRKFAEFWRQKGRDVESVEMLLLSYYSSIRVVRVPERGRPKLINEQVQTLYTEIEEACNRSRASKHNLRMLLNSDELQPYLQYAFDHFSRNLEKPFDFVQAALSHSPITSDLNSNLLKLAIDITTLPVWKDKLDGFSIFVELSYMAASCIMVECARRRTLGPAEKILGAYVGHLDKCLENFCDRHWPCEYVHPGTQGRCVNVKAGHTKGHQLQNGKVLSVGEYQSEFTFEHHQDFFHYYVLQILTKLLQKLSDATVDSPQLELEKALEIHRTQILTPFFKHLHGSQNFVSHTACYSCLMEPPEHPLPCGHVLCTACIKGFGSQRGRTLWEIGYCPQHYDDEYGQFPTSWPIHIKPPGAGVRILTLDGGGVRGIIELCILREVEKRIGQGLPLQLFFDLIVGTSTGGVIALGLGANGWTIHKCLKTFEKLCKQAFTKRKGIGVPGIEHFVTVANHSRYETIPIEQALKSAFGEDQNLFAGSREDVQDQAMLQRLTKVAVVTTTLANAPAVLANYNRREEPETGNYQFHRSEKSENEVKTWEAARATSAAPLFFKPYVHQPSGQTYQDGCLYHNNPIRVAIREQKLIWPDRAESCPDIILSLGTGVNESLRTRRPAPRPSRFGLLRTFQNLASMATDHIQSSLNSEQTWREFIADASPPAHLKDRYKRLNLRMDGAPPRMDEVQKLQELKEMTLSRFTKNSSDIKDVADHLLATSFYFALIPEEMVVVDGETCIYGMIHCRFPPGPQIRALGETLEARSRKAYNQNHLHHRPYFVIQERRREAQARQVTLPHEVTSRMITEGLFTMSKVEIRVSDSNAETDILFCFADRPGSEAFFPISGFPRCFAVEVEKALRPRLVQAPQTLVKVEWELFDAKKAFWKFSHAKMFTNKDPLGDFGSADYKNPGNIGDSQVQALSDRYSSVGFSSSSFTEPVSELAAHAEVEEVFDDSDKEDAPSEEEVIRMQWIRLLMAGGMNHVIGYPEPFVTQISWNKPGLLPKSSLNRQRKAFVRSVLYKANGISAIGKLLGKAKTLPGEPFELADTSTPKPPPTPRLRAYYAP